MAQVRSYLNFDTSAQTASQNDHHIIEQYQLALMMQDGECASNLLKNQQCILPWLKYKAGSNPAATWSNFKNLLDHFEMILLTRMSEMIAMVWDDNPTLKKWYYGEEINFGDEKQSYCFYIVNAKLIDMIKNVLQTGDTNLINKLLMMNSRAVNSFSDMSFSDLVSVLTSMRAIQEYDTNNLQIFCGFINVIANRFALQAVISKFNVQAGKNIVDDAIINRCAVLTVPLITPITTYSITTSEQNSHKRQSPDGNNSANEIESKKQKLNENFSISGNSSVVFQGNLFPVTSIAINNNKLPDVIIEAIRDSFPTTDSLTSIVLDARSRRVKKRTVTKNFVVSVDVVNKIKNYPDSLKEIGVEIAPAKSRRKGDISSARIDIFNLNLYEIALTKYKVAAYNPPIVPRPFYG